jgi:hypothetical protein
VVFRSAIYFSGPADAPSETGLVGAVVPVVTVGALLDDTAGGGAAEDEELAVSTVVGELFPRGRAWVDGGRAVTSTMMITNNTTSNPQNAAPIFL